jgi:hypothetical protein
VPVPLPVPSLVPGPDLTTSVEAFVSGVHTSGSGTRVGLEGVLLDLNRVARPAYFTRSAATRAFRWDEEDDASARWWPQGMTSSADAGPEEEYAGRRLILASAYAKELGGVSKGARISVLDITDEAEVRYRHVLLVNVQTDADGVTMHPVHAHAGGIVWRGRLLHVARTAHGLLTFDLDDIVRLEDRSVAHGYRYVLPLRGSHVPAPADLGEQPARGRPAPPLRYSFVSLGRDRGRVSLLAGEYGHGRMTRRLVRHSLDASGQLTVTNGVSEGVLVAEKGPARMQGAVSVDDRLHVVTSNGKRGNGSLWVGPPGAVRRHARVLPPGPEDVTWWPSRDELWTPTEYPGNRLVLALDRVRFR